MKPPVDSPQRVDIIALMRALPVSGLEPQCLASIRGLVEVPRDRGWQERIDFLEPPAGGRCPYIDPAKALEKLMRRQGISPDDAKARAHRAVAQLKKDVAEARWVNFFDDINPESPECLPVSDFVAWLRDESRSPVQLPGASSHDARGGQAPAPADIVAPAEILDLFEQAAEVAATTPIFRGPDNWDSPWSLENLHASPPPKAMIEFIPGAPWADIDDWGEWKSTDNPFLRWRESMVPVALELERALGEPVYRFADLSSDTDDDDVHRFLVLHWCCTWKPKSAFVRYLLKVSGTDDVEELKAALIDPSSYSQPFKMNFTFIGLEARTCLIDYLPPEERQTVTVVFLTQQAREVAQFLLAQKIGAHALIVAPKELATDDWVKHAARHCRDWTIRYVYDRKLDDPIDVLAATDELCVIADDQRPKSGFDLKLSEPIEDLLCLALDLKVEATYYGVDRSRLSNPDLCLHKLRVPERVAARQSLRLAFTKDLTELRLDNDFGSTGLWDARGRNLPYDLLDLPFPLIRRIAAWQRSFDEQVSPPDMSDAAWRARHQQEALAIADALQIAVGPHVTVSTYREAGWTPIGGAGSIREGRSERVLVEEDVVLVFAKAWNRLEPGEFLTLLAPDARYVSQWVFDELVGAPAIADYLRSKMRTVRANGVNDPDARVRVEIGRTAHGNHGRPCAFMTQGRGDVVKAAVVFEVRGGNVVRYDLCIPQILGAVRTGVFPI